MIGSEYSRGAHLESAIALVVGASSGIGAAVASGLVARGCRTILAGRSVTAGENGRSFGMVLDVADGRSVENAFEMLPSSWREIDIVVNCAGIALGGRNRFDVAKIEDRIDTVTTNLAGAMRVCHAVLPGMIARKKGHVVNIGSVASSAPYPNDAAYIASKFGLHGFTDSLRLDLAGTGIRVTEIRPGVTETGFAKVRYGGDAAAAQDFYARMPAKLRPEDVADCALFALEAPQHVNVCEIFVQPATATTTF